MDLNIKMDKDLTSYRGDAEEERVTAEAGATVNGASGSTFNVILDDNGEPGRDDDVTCQLFYGDDLVFELEGQTLNKDGNLQFHAK